MKIVLYGSCQLQAIAKLIEADKSMIEFLCIQNWVFMINQKELPTEMFNCDIFIYQPFNGNPVFHEYHTDVILKKLKPEVLKISVPFIASGLYWPDVFSDPRNETTKRVGLIDFGKFPQQSSALSKYLSLSEALESYKKEIYTSQFLMTFVQTALEKMKVNEQRCDIQVYEYILENYQKEILFHSVQHPNNSVLIHVAKQIIKKIPNDLLKFKTPTSELLKDHSVLVLPAVQNFLRVSIQTFKLNGRGLVSADGYVEEYYKWINSQGIKKE